MLFSVTKFLVVSDSSNRKRTCPRWAVLAAALVTCLALWGLMCRLSQIQLEYKHVDSSYVTCSRPHKSQRTAVSPEASARSRNIIPPTIRAQVLTVRDLITWLKWTYLWEDIFKCLHVQAGKDSKKSSSPIHPPHSPNFLNLLQVTVKHFSSTLNVEMKGIKTLLISNLSCKP